MSDQIKDEQESEVEDTDFSEAFAEAVGDKPAKEVDEAEEASPEEKTVEDRGKALLDQEADFIKQEEHRRAEEARAIEAARAEEEAHKVVPLTDEGAQLFRDLIAEGEIPETLKLDGEDFNLKEYMTDFPEVQVIAGQTTQKVLERLVDNGVLMTAAQHDAKLAEVENRVADRIFDLSVLQQVPDAYDIVDNDGYKKWTGEANKEVKALLRSRDPNDLAMALKQYKRTAKIARPKTGTIRGKARLSSSKAIDEDDFSKAFAEAIRE